MNLYIPLSVMATRAAPNPVKKHREPLNMRKPYVTILEYYNHYSNRAVTCWDEHGIALWW